MKIETESSLASLRRTHRLHRRVTDALVLRWRHGWAAVAVLGVAWAVAVVRHRAVDPVSAGEAAGAVGTLLAVGVFWMVGLAVLHAFWQGRLGRAALMAVVWPIAVLYTVRAARKIRERRAADD